MILASIVWDIKPEILPLGPLSLRWYGLLFALGFVFSYIIFKKIFKREGYSIEMLDQLTMYVAIGCIVGARLGHCLFYGPQFDVFDANGRLLAEGYLSHPFNILKIWEGGLASHGSAIGMVTALYLFSRKHKLEFVWLLDRIGIAVAIAGMCVRLGNLMNSEIYGVETSLPWGFIFVREGETVAKHPTQIYEALSYLSIFIFLFWSYTKGFYDKTRGLFFGIFVILLFGARFLIEYIKNPQEDFEKGLPINMGQILSIPFILVGILFIVYAVRKMKQAEKTK